MSSSRFVLRSSRAKLCSYVCCILVVISILYLFNGTQVELMSIQKQAAHCQQQHEALYSQLQKAAEYKLRLEKSLTSERESLNKDMQDLKSALVAEKEANNKEREISDAQFQSLTLKCQFVESEKVDLKEENDKLKSNLEKNEKEKLDMITKVRIMERELAEKRKALEDYQAQLAECFKIKAMVPSQRTKEANVVNVADKNEAAHSSAGGNSTTPVINPDAIIGHEESVKQLAKPNVVPSAAQKGDNMPVAPLPLPSGDKLSQQSQDSLAGDNHGGETFEHAPNNQGILAKPLNVEGGEGNENNALDHPENVENNAAEKTDERNADSYADNAALLMEKRRKLPPPLGFNKEFIHNAINKAQANIQSLDRNQLKQDLKNSAIKMDYHGEEYDKEMPDDDDANYDNDVQGEHIQRIKPKVVESLDDKNMI